MQEFKVGDRVRLEGVISRLWGEGGAWVNFTGSNEETGITREEMAHAKLIQPKPRYDWSTIPPEYDWMATDRGGTVYAYKNKPVPDAVTNVEGQYWYDGKGSVKHIRPGSFTADWRDSLEQRPEEVEAAVKVAEEKALDLSKPVRIKVRQDVEVREVFGPSSRGFYLVDRADGILDIRLVEELENIPEPKITTSDVLSLWEFKTGARAFLWGDAAGCTTRLSQVRVSYTEGEGWSIEEVK